MASGVKLRLHPIHRDETEKYLVVYGRGDIEVYDSAGVAATVTTSAAANLYLETGVPDADDLRLVTVADFTIIVNTKVDLATEEEITHFSVTERFDTYTKMTSRVLKPLAYYETNEDDGAHLKGFYQYVIPDDANNGFASWTANTPVGQNFKRASANYANTSYQPMGFRARFQRQTLVISDAAYTTADHKLTKAAGFSSYTYKAGDEIHLDGTGTAPLPEGWYAVTAATANDVTLDYNGSTGINYRDSDDDAAVYLDATGDKAGSDTDYISASGNISHNFTSTPASDMDDVAEKLQTSLRGNTGLETACIYWDQLNEKFHVIAPFRGTGTAVIDFTDNPSTDNHLILINPDPPFKFSSGTALPGSGASPTDPEGDEVIEIDSRFGQVAAPGEADTEFNPNTMPVKMTRTTTNPLAFDIDVIDWKERLSGDHDSNPGPSLFVDHEGNEEDTAIADIGFHRNRLVLAGDESVVLSQDGDFFNFFINDASNVVASDPIDRSLSSDQVTIIDFVVSFRATLVVFTKAGRQFELNAPEAFTPNTVAITPTTSYTHTPGIRPKRMHDTLMFISDDGNRSMLLDYRFNDELAESSAEDVSAHVADLMPSGMKNLVLHPNNGTAFCLPTECNVILVYQNFQVGSRREQAAWSKWIFPTDYQIDDIAVIDDELFLMYWDLSADKRRLEKMDISRDSVNPDPECYTDTDPTC
jgi:hypothetical protein